jgi:hypothetical protein
MAGMGFDLAPLLAPNLPPPAPRWTGFPRYNFVGGHNDPEHVPLEALGAAANTVLQREGRTLATYGLQSGPLGYRPLREFLARKLGRHAGIVCDAEEILITSGSLQAIDLVKPDEAPGTNPRHPVLHASMSRMPISSPMSVMAERKQVAASALDSHAATLASSLPSRLAGSSETKLVIEQATSVAEPRVVMRT